MGDLSKDFSRWEFECRGCCGKSKPKKRLINGIQKFRNRVGRRVDVRSGYSCLKHNGQIPGRELTSTHLDGLAVDLERVRGMTFAEMAQIASEIPEFRDGGIAVYDTHIHLDVRQTGRPARWGKKWKVK